MEDKEEEVGVDDGFALVYSVTYDSTIQEVRTHIVSAYYRTSTSDKFVGTIGNCTFVIKI